MRWLLLIVAIGCFAWSHGLQSEGDERLLRAAPGTPGRLEELQDEILRLQGAGTLNIVGWGSLIGFAAMSWPRKRKQQPAQGETSAIDHAASLPARGLSIAPLIMNFLWPQKIKTEPGGVARLGRVLHWFFALVAIAFVLGGGLAWLLDPIDSNGLLFLAFGPPGPFFFGRAVRYVFSGE